MSNSANFPLNDPPEGVSSATRALTPVAAPGTVAVPGKRSLRTRPEILTARPSPGALLDSLRRRLWLAMGLGIVAAAGVSLALWFIIPAKYEAYAQLRVNSQAQYWLFPPSGSTDFDNYKRTQQNMIKSHQVLFRALEDPKISQSPLLKSVVDKEQWLITYLTVEYPLNSEIMRISLKGENAEYLAPIVNAVYDAYFKEVVEAETTEKRRRHDDLESKYQTLANSIKTKMIDLQLQAEEHQAATTTAANTKMRLAEDHLRELNSEFYTLQKQLEENVLEFGLLQTRLANPNTATEEIPELDRDPRLAELEKNRQAIDAEIARISSTVRRPQNDPTYIRKTQEKAAVTKQIEDLKKTVQDEYRRRVQKGVTPDNKGGHTIPELKLINETLTARIQGVKKQVEEQTVELLKMGGYSVDLEAKTAELGHIRAVYQEVGVQLEKLNLEINAPPRITGLEVARTPTDLDRRYKIIAVAFGGLVAFGLIGLSVSRLEFEARRMSNATEVTHELGLRHVGGVPSLTGLRLGRMFKGSGLQAVHDQVTEAIDSIRAAIVYQASQMSESPVVLVTSALEHEGKSTVANRLAVSLANAGRRTLLIDGNFRSPQVHKTFNVPQDPGIGDLLRDLEQAPQALVRDTDVPGLSVLASGMCDETSLQNLARGGLRTILANLRQHFQFIVVDCPPVLTTADSLAFAENANVTLLSTRRDVSRIPRVYEACERLKAMGVEVSGVVVNGEK